MIDLYCERLGLGLCAEPLNALTNLGSLVAALASWQLARRSESRDGSLASLIALMVAIGAGSALFPHVRDGLGARTRRAPDPSVPALVPVAILSYGCRRVRRTQRCS